MHMKTRIRKIVSLLLLVVFLIPSTGMVLYVHHCNMSNSTVYDTERPSGCCGDAGCAISHASDNEVTALTAAPCCDNSQLFVKLGLHLLSHTVKVLTADYPVINSGVAQIIWSDVPTNEQITAGNLLLYPPGELPFIMNSSLRL